MAFCIHAVCVAGCSVRGRSNRTVSGSGFSCRCPWVGIAFGDALAQELGLTRVIVEDDYGRDPALILEGTSIISFPLTAISKRVQAGEAVDVRALFRSASETIARLRDEQA
jgi:hypothetical protein